MIRIEGIYIVAARLAAELKSRKAAEISAPFHQLRIRQGRPRRFQQPSGPIAQGGYFPRGPDDCARTPPPGAPAQSTVPAPAASTRFAS